MRKRIPLRQPRIGMYVAGIDCSWFRTPFLTHRFLVKTEEQIERLGLITTINPATLHRPVVALTYDKTGNPYRNPLTIDLANQDQSLHAPLNVWSHQNQGKRVAQPNAPRRT